MIIDFHAHILPRTDHGCVSSAMSHAQLQLMKKYGTDAVVATPHFYPNQNNVDSFLRARDGAIGAMRAKLPLEDLPTVYPAAEVLVCEEIHKMPGLEELTVRGTNIILLEMPFVRWSDDLIQSVLGVRERGLCPVLAHIDRYFYDDVQILLKEGIKAQLNAEACGLFGNHKRFMSLMESGQVVALGSDLHEAKAGDYRRFVKAQKKLGKQAAPLFARTEALLKGAVSITDPTPEREKALV